MTNGLLNRVTFWVPGTPRPGGSKRAFLHRKTGKLIVTEDCARSKDWRTAVSWAAVEAMRGKPPLDGPLSLHHEFFMPRPKGHYGSGKKCYTLRASAAWYPDKKPDYGKLARSTDDALTGIVWRDDSQIVEAAILKRYGPRTGARIVVERMPDPGILPLPGAEPFSTLDEC